MEMELEWVEAKGLTAALVQAKGWFAAWPRVPPLGFADWSQSMKPPWEPAALGKAKGPV